MGFRAGTDPLAGPDGTMKTYFASPLSGAAAATAAGFETALRTRA